MLPHPDLSTSTGSSALTVRTVAAISIISIFTTLLVWAPFAFRYGGLSKQARAFGFESIYRNYDGMLFVIPAKTNYRSDQVEKYKVLDLKHTYYAAHTPGYPLLIKLVAPLVGYLPSMLVINVIASVVLGCLLYLFYLRFFESTSPLLLTTFTLLLPRLWILRSTGSSEIVFLCCILASLLLMQDKRYWLAAIFAAYASFTRIHGLLFGIAIALYVVHQYITSRNRSLWGLLVSVGSLTGFVATCMLYLRQYGDFFAYFHTGAVVPTGLIYSQFDSTAKEIKTFFLEDILVYFAIGWIYIFDQLTKQKNMLFYFFIVYFAFILTVQHRDLARYLLPIMPILIGSAATLFEKRAVRFALVAIVPAVYWYVINFMSSNMFLDSMRPFM